MVFAYARVAGTALTLLGVAGIVADGRPLLGVLNTDPVENVAHLVAGVLLLYAGFVRRDDAFARIVVSGVGLAFLLVGMIGFAYPKLLGLLPGGLSVADDLLHLALGALAIAAVELPRRGTGPSGDGGLPEAPLETGRAKQEGRAR